MDSQNIYDELIRIAEKQGFIVMEKRLNPDEMTAGGSYTLRGSNYILLNLSAPLDERVKILINEIKNGSTEDFYISPIIRKILLGE